MNLPTPDRPVNQKRPIPESSTDHHVYAPPASDLCIDATRASPRLRFWIACLWSLVFAPVLFHGLAAFRAPALLFPVVALMAWLGPLSWVVSAHLQRSLAHASFARMIIVAVGLTIAMAFLAVLGMGIAGVLLPDPGLDWL